MLRKELNLFDAISVVVGTIIGSGIFLIPSSIAARLDCFNEVLLVWIVGGILTLFGALSLAELGSIYPDSGGLCTYLQHAYGPLTAFLYAWALLLMIHSGSIAALAVAFGLFLGQVLPLNAFEIKLFSVIIIAILTIISCLGIRPGKLVQNLIAGAKVTGLAAIILLLAIKGSRPINLLAACTAHSQQSFVAEFGVALVAVLWAYEAWHVVSFVAGEMKRPQVNLPRSLFWGSAIVMLIFIAANLGYYRVLSSAEIRASNAVAAAAVGRALNPGAAMLISVLILVSTAGSMNGMILTGPRVYYAMAHKGIFPRLFGQVSERYRTPIVALVIQGVWACLLAASGTYEQLFTHVIFTAWVFYALGVAGVIVLRQRQPRLKRSFCVPGYPWIPLFFCFAALGLILNNLIERPVGVLLGLGFIASGIPIYFYAIRDAS